MYPNNNDKDVTMMMTTTKMTKRVMMMMTSFFLLSVTGISAAPTIIRNPPLVLSSEPSHLKFKEGETIRMECPVFSQPQAIVSWFKDGSPIHQGWLNFRAAGINLRIRNVSRGDAGWYKCLAVNGFGSAEVKMYLEILSDDEKGQITPSNQSATTNSTTSSPTHRRTFTTPHKHSSIQNQEIYILIATGLIFFGVAICLIVLAVLIRLTCGLQCRESCTDSKGSHESLKTTNNDYVSSSASLLFVSSDALLRNDHKIQNRSTWSLLRAATLAERNDNSEGLKF